MKKIHAFIGHSFDDSDKILVRKFLDIFDTVKELNIPFSWDHAEKAEPEILSTKVLQKMQNANTFIGICTKKEKVINRDPVKKTFFNKSKFILSEEDYVWKTSDWIIQEIGCAFGREMKTILLVEKGLRQPGGLQGNLEYIEFDRNNPEKIIQKILEMIQKLIPKSESVSGIQQEQTEPRSNQDKEKIQKSSEGNCIIEIKEDWKNEDFVDGLISTIVFKDSDKEKQIVDAFGDKFGENCKEEADIFLAKKLYYKFLVNDEENLEAIKTILNKYKNNSELNRMIAFIYEKCNQYEYASKHYFIATENCNEITTKINSLSSAIINFVKDGNIEYQDHIDKLIELDNNGSHKEIIYKTLSKIAKLVDNDYIYSLILESAVNDFPFNTDFRFDLAYNYSQNGNNNFSYFHYKFLTDHFAKNAAYWNNLGVSANRLELSYKAISAYRESEKLGGTLAMSNIAKQFISSGFYDEAEKLCKKALEKKDYDKKVIEDLATIEKNKTKEEGTENQTINEVTSKRKNLLQISKGLLHKQIKSLKKHYNHPDSVLNLTIKNDEIKLHGTYSKKDPFSSLLTNLVTNESDNEAVHKYQIEINGKINRHLIDGKYTNCKLDTPKEEISNKSKQIIMVVSSDMNKIIIYDKSKYEKLFELFSLEENAI